MLQGNNSGNKYSCQIKANLQSVVKALKTSVLPRGVLVDHNDGGGGGGGYNTRFLPGTV